METHHYIMFLGVFPLLGIKAFFFYQSMLGECHEQIFSVLSLGTLASMILLGFDCVGIILPRKIAEPILSYWLFGTVISVISIPFELGLFLTGKHPWQKKRRGKWK